MSMREKARNLHEGRRGMYEQVEEYHARFLDPNTGLIRAELTDTRPCPVCGVDEARVAFVKRGGTYVTCGNCTMCYLNPVFCDRALREYYEANHATQAEVTANESDFYRTLYTRGLVSVEAHAKRGPALDIGCSSGFFLDIAVERGWEPWGIELNKKEFVLAAKKHKRVFNVPLEEANLERQFMLISMWDVFEHIKDGAGMLGRLRSMLAPGGVLFMQIPSAASLAARVMHAACNVFDGIEHVNLYSPRTIRELARITSYEILSLESVISELHVLRNYLSYDDPYFGASKEIGPLEFVTEDAIHSALAGYKLQVVLRPC